MFCASLSFGHIKSQLFMFSFLCREDTCRAYLWKELFRLCSALMGLLLTLFPGIFCPDTIVLFNIYWSITVWRDKEKGEAQRKGCCHGWLYFCCENELQWRYSAAWLHTPEGFKLQGMNLPHSDGKTPYIMYVSRNIFSRYRKRYFRL